MSVKAKVEAIIYATEDPVTLNQLVSLLKDVVLAEMRAEEEARLALNETVAEVRPVETNEEDEFADEGVSGEDEASFDEGVVSEAVPADEGSSFNDGKQLASDDVNKEQKYSPDKQQLHDVKARVNGMVEQLMSEYASSDRGMEIRQIAGGYRMATKPEHHDVVVNFAKSLKPPVRLSLQALETLAVIAYKQPVTVPEISEVRGVDASGVIATLLDRKLVTTAGRKQVIGRPILYKTTKEFLLRFGLKDIAELPSVEEFEKLSDAQSELFTPTIPPHSAASPSTENPDPVTEAVPELTDTNNRENAPISQLEEQPAEENFEPVTEAVPQLVADENREGLPEAITDEMKKSSGDQQR